MPKPKAFNVAQFEANMSALPEIAYALHTMDNSVILIKRGETGFYPVDADKFPRILTEPEAFVADTNDAMGVRPSESMAMVMGSIFRWDMPGAHPEAHKLHDLYYDLEKVDPDAGFALAGRARAMAKAGADYDTILEHFRENFALASICREFKCDPSELAGYYVAKENSDMFNTERDNDDLEVGTFYRPNFDEPTGEWTVAKITGGVVQAYIAVKVPA